MAGRLPYREVPLPDVTGETRTESAQWIIRGERLIDKTPRLRVSLAVLIPVSLIYMAVAQPFIQLAIHHGAVGASGAHLVTTTLVFFLAGLPGFSAFFLLMRAFQSDWVRSDPPCPWRASGSRSCWAGRNIRRRAW